MMPPIGVEWVRTACGVVVDAIAGARRDQGWPRRLQLRHGVGEDVAIGIQIEA